MISPSPTLTHVQDQQQYNFHQLEAYLKAIMIQNVRLTGLLTELSERPGGLGVAGAPQAPTQQGIATPQWLKEWTMKALCTESRHFAYVHVSGVTPSPAAIKSWTSGAFELLNAHRSLGPAGTSQVQELLTGEHESKKRVGVPCLKQPFVQVHSPAVRYRYASNLLPWTVRVAPCAVCVSTVALLTVGDHRQGII